MCRSVLGFLRTIVIWVWCCSKRNAVQMLHTLRRSVHLFLEGSRKIVRWGLRELGEPWLCAGCVYLGVISTALLPATLLTALLSATVPVNLLPTHILPGTISLAISPLAALPIAARVFDIRAYDRWRIARRDPLGVRMLRAYSDGVDWLRWWRALQSRRHLPPKKR